MSLVGQKNLVSGQLTNFYYAGKETCEIMSSPYTDSTRRIFSLGGVQGSSETVSVGKGYGMSDLMLFLQLPTTTDTDCGVCAGWAYDAIRSITWEAGSARYSLTGQQLLIELLTQQAESSSAAALLNLGGNNLVSAALAALTTASTSNMGMAYISLPWNKPSAVGKPLPFPTDLLEANVMITVELTPLSHYMSAEVAAHVPTGNYPKAYLQMRTMDLKISGDKYKAGPSNVLSYPTRFVGQANTVACANSAAQQAIILPAGIGGVVREVVCWLTKGSDAGAALRNVHKTYDIQNYQQDYDGIVYARYNYKTSKFFNLVDGTNTQIANALLTGPAANVFAAANSDVVWINAPFGQKFQTETGHVVVGSGIAVTTNMNVLLTTPTAAADYVFNYYYVYNAAFAFGNNTCMLELPRD